MTDVPEYQPKPYKKRGLTTPQKLMAAGGFLVFVALAIGGEDRPGVITMAQKTIAPETAESNDTALQIDDGSTVQQSQSAQNDAELSDWYASSTPDANPLVGVDAQDDQSDSVDQPEISPDQMLILEDQISKRPIQIGPNN